MQASSQQLSQKELHMAVIKNIEDFMRELCQLEEFLYNERR